MTLYETPAPTQGFTVLQLLDLLELFEVHRHGHLSPDPGHLMVQSKVAHHDRDRHLGAAYVDLPMRRLISKEHADRAPRPDGPRNDGAAIGY